jgi:hypothetical protein
VAGPPGSPYRVRAARRSLIVARFAGMAAGGAPPGGDHAMRKTGASGLTTGALSGWVAMMSAMWAHHRFITG